MTVASNRRLSYQRRMEILAVFGPAPGAPEPIYAGVRFAGERVVGNVVERSPEVVARRLVAGRSQAVALHPWNRELAEGMGLPVAEPTEAQAKALAQFVLGFVNGGSLAKITDWDLLDAFLAAVGECFEEEAWFAFEPLVGMPASVKGASIGDREVMALGGGALGLSIQASGSAAIVEEVLHASKEDILRKLDALMLFAEDETEWPLAFLAPYGIRNAWPLVIRFVQGKHQPVRADEARLLVAGIRAFTEAARSGSTGTGACENRGKRVEVSVDPEGIWFERGHAPAHPAYEIKSRVAIKIAGLGTEVANNFSEWLFEEELGRVEDLEFPFGIYLRPYEGKTMARRAWDAGLLTEVEKEWVVAEEAALTCLLEIEGEAEGGQLAARDALTGESLVIEPGDLSEIAAPGVFVFCRLVDWQGERLVCGHYPGLVSPAEAQAIRDAFGAEGESSEPERTLRLVSHFVRALGLD